MLPQPQRGRVVQVDPNKPTLKAPGTTRLNLKCHEPLSKSAFIFNLRRYTVDRLTFSVEWEMNPEASAFS